MKTATAEEWADSQARQMLHVCETIQEADFERVRAFLMRHNKQIQLYSVRAGMHKAANLIRREIETCGCNVIDRNGCESCNAKENSRIDIIAAAERLTEKDL